jgi:DNA repair ATPase RecN
MLQELKEQYTLLNNQLHAKLGRRDALVSKLNEAESRIKIIDSEMDIATKASLFMQNLSDTTRKEIVEKISSIVTDALQKVKDKNLEFKMSLTTERNQVDLKFTILNKTTGQEYDILSSCGGGIADIVTFPLRISLLLKWSPELARVMILDESFKFVGVQDQELLGEFIRQISERLNIQILLVTHSPTLSNKAHKMFTVSKKGDESFVEERL